MMHPVGCPFREACRTRLCCGCFLPSTTNCNCVPRNQGTASANQWVGVLHISLGCW